MATGDEEVLGAFEEVITRNVRTNVEFSQVTRGIVRDLEEQVQRLQNNILTQKNLIDELRDQLSKIQQKLYIGGTAENVTIEMVQNLIEENKNK